MWSIGNEIYDTHFGNGLEITKKLYEYVVKSDPNRNAPITIGSNYMMTEGAQKCAKILDTIGYNYLEDYIMNIMKNILNGKFMVQKLVQLCKVEEFIIFLNRFN